MILKTARLELTPFAREHVDFLHRLWTDPDVRRFLWDDRVISREEVAEVVEASLASFEARGFGFWVVREVGSGDAVPIGFAGLREFGDAGEIELMYGLAPQRWGRGLATEAARVVLDFARDVCQLGKVHAGTDPPNAASIRVIERLGMELEGPRTLGGVEAVYYVASLESACPR